MKTDYIVIRHKSSGVPDFIARHCDAAVINAGDGFHAHPTQALLDAFTLSEVLPDFSGHRILVVGDILHSRVARSVLRCLHTLGAEVGVFGPGPLIPRHRPDFIHTFDTFEQALAWKPHVVYLLRLQLERQQANFFPSLREYHRLFGINRERWNHIRGEGLWVMHPGPVNRGVELVDEVMDYERTLINQQVENGIAMRMAILLHLQPREKEVDA